MTPCRVTEVWSIAYERPVDSKDGFARAIWCWSEGLASYGLAIRIIYLATGETRQVIKERVGKVQLFGLAEIGSGVIRRLSFYRDALRLIDSNARTDARRIFVLHGPFALPLSLFLRARGSVIYHTFGSMISELTLSAKELVALRDVHKLLLYMLEIPLEILISSQVDAVVIPHRRAAEELLQTHLLTCQRLYIVPYGQNIRQEFTNDAFLSDVRSVRQRIGQKKLVLFVGGTAWNRKGGRYVILAFSKLRRRLPSVLIMTGNATEREISQTTRLGLRIGEDLQLPGLVDDRTLALLYASCDVFVLPSFHEGFSQPVIEAMAFGKPVVASPSAAYPTVRNNSEGFIVPPQNYGEIAKALEEILKNGRLYSSMSSNARRRARSYSWDVVIRRLVKVLDEITSGHFEHLVTRVSDVSIYSMSAMDIIQVHKLYDSLPESSKRYFHPGFLGFTQVGLVWLLYQFPLMASSIQHCRKIQLRLRPGTVIIGIVAKNKESQVIGFSFVVLKRESKDSFLLSADLGIVVRCDQRDAGIGSLLMRRVLKEARGCGVDRIDLIVSQDNPIAVHLYEKHGFKATTMVKDNWHGTPIDCVAMSLELKAS